MTTNEIDQSVWSILRSHRGHENPISRRKLQQYVGISDRAVRYSIERLKQRGEKIGCLWQRDGGYFVMVTLEDVERGERQYRQQALTMLRRLRESMSPAERLEFAGQARMALVGGEE